MTRRRAVSRPKIRTLPPPQRFRPVSPWKSAGLLMMLVVVVALLGVGAFELSRLNIVVYVPFLPTTPASTAMPSPLPSPTVKPPSPTP